MDEVMLGTWKVHIYNVGKDNYDFIYDDNGLIILDSFKSLFAFIKVSTQCEQENIVLEKLPYYIKYEIESSKRCLSIFIS